MLRCHDVCFCFDDGGVNVLGAALLSLMDRSRGLTPRVQAADCKDEMGRSAAAFSFASLVDDVRSTMSALRLRFLPPLLDLLLLLVDDDEVLVVCPIFLSLQAAMRALAL